MQLDVQIVRYSGHYEFICQGVFIASCDSWDNLNTEYELACKRAIQLFCK